jgi:hypothetical protein
MKDLTFLPDHAFRPGSGLAPPLDWRWRRARHLFEAKKRPGRRDDRAVRSALKYLQKKEAGTRLRGLARAIDAALVLRQDSEQPRRWLVEALLLARATPEEAGRRMSEQAAVVRWYSRLFFDIQEHLGAVDWIVQIILAGRERHAIRADDQEFLMKFYAYHGGLLVLEDVLFYFEMPAPPPERGARLRWLRVRAAVLSRILPSSPRLLPLFPELIQLTDYQQLPAPEDDRPSQPLRVSVTLDELVAQVTQQAVAERSRVSA